MSTAIVSDAELEKLLTLRGEILPPGLSYGTVRDVAQGTDLCPTLLGYNNDLKDGQRFWTLKAILASCPPGSTLLEIGAGEPVVADVLGRLGYRVIVVDPYEGAGNGPREIDQFRKVYRHVEYNVAWFSPDLAGLRPASVDCCYSISVVEHVPIARLSVISDGIHKFTRPGGTTVHAIDFVAMGAGAEFHTELTRTFAGLLGFDPAEADQAIQKAARDADTYYLSAEAHNRWRGATPYDEFPMRRVHSVQIAGLPPRPVAPGQGA